MLDKITKFLVSFLRIVCTILIVGLSVVVTLQIISRLFKISMPWAEELARFLLIWLTFIGCSLGIHTKGHLAVDFVVDMLPAPVRLFVNLFAQLVICLFFVVILVFGVRLSISTMGTLSSTLQWPNGLVYSVMPISSVFSLYFLALNIIDTIKNGKKGA